MPVTVSWKDNTRIAEFRDTRVGRKILARALSKTAISGKAEGKRRILQVFTIRTSKVKIKTTPARADRLEATIESVNTDPRGKKAIPLHDFAFKYTGRRKGQKHVKGRPPYVRGEIVRGQPVEFKGGFAILGSSSGKVVTVRRVGEARYPTKTLLGPSAGAMFTNPRVVDPLIARISERLPVVLEQEVNFAMNFETDKGKEVQTDDPD